MNILLSLLAVVLFTFILNVTIIQSNNIIFMVFRKPVVWIIFMGSLSFLYFFTGSRFNNSFNIVWWSALLAFFVNIPPKSKGVDKTETNVLIDKMYNDMGIRKGRLKYRLGLIAYLIGGILGWILFYSKVVVIQ